MAHLSTNFEFQLHQPLVGNSSGLSHQLVGNLSEQFLHLVGNLCERVLQLVGNLLTWNGDFVELKWSLTAADFPSSVARPRPR